jgi:perosamine synthetase
MLIPHSRPTLDQHDKKAVARVLESGSIAQGAEVKKFEHKMATLHNVRYAMACSSGTTALHLALIGLDVKSHDEVIMPSYVCSSPYFATLHAGAEPKIVDINHKDLNISDRASRNSICNKTKAIIVPHMFGNPAGIIDFRDLGVPVIEDCAQSLGAEYKKKKVGSLGDLSVFSFYATKMITTGEGGMVLTNNKEYYSRIVEARDYDKKPLTPTKYNYKMTDIQAALGLSQLGRLLQFISLRRKIASIYSDEFDQFKISFQQVSPFSKPVYFRYVMLIQKEKLIREEARKSGVMCEKPVWKPLHKDLRSVECPNSDYVQIHAISIPIYPSLTREEVEHVTESLKAAFRKHLPS